MTRTDAITRVAQDLGRGLDWQEAIDSLANSGGYDLPNDDDLAEAQSIVRAAERQLGWA